MWIMWCAHLVQWLDWNGTMTQVDMCEPYCIFGKQPRIGGCQNRPHRMHSENGSAHRLCVNRENWFVERKNRKVFDGETIADLYATFGPISCANGWRILQNICIQIQQYEYNLCASIFYGHLVAMKNSVYGQCWASAYYSHTICSRPMWRNAIPSGWAFLLCKPRNTLIYGFQFLCWPARERLTVMHTK